MTGLDGKGLAALARLAEAFDVCGKIGPDAPMLVLRCASATVLGSGDESATIDELMTELRRLFQGPVLVVPHGWTQEHIDVEAARMLVHAEREACAALVEGLSLGRDEDVSEMRERVAAQIRARGQK